MIVLGWRGTAVAAGPRCSRCGYDLRGTIDAEIPRCSECGLNLTDPSAVSRGRRSKQPKLMLAGMVIVALPWILLGFQSLRNFVGPHWERLRSNASIINSIATDPTWEWDELYRRLNLGSLSPAEASAAVDELSKTSLRRSSTAGHSRFWIASPFFQAADQKGDVSDTAFLKIAQSYFADTPGVSVGPVHLDLPAFCSIVGRSDWPSSVYHPEFAIRKVWMDDPTEPANVPGEATPLPAASAEGINLRDAPENWIKATYLTPGQYWLKFLIDVAVVPSASGRGFNYAAPGRAHVYPGARAQWATTVTAPLVVLAAAEQPYQLRLEDSDELDPRQAGSVSVSSVDAICFADATIIIVHTATDRLGVNCYFDPFIVVAGHEYSGLGQPRFWFQNESNADLFSCRLGRVAAELRTIDLILRPDTAAATRGKLPSIWSKTMSFLNVPIRRRIFPWNQPVPSTDPAMN